MKSLAHKPKTLRSKRSKVKNRVGQAIIDKASETSESIEVIRNKIFKDIPSIGPTLLRRIERNSSQPSFVEAYLIAKSIGCSVDQLYNVK